MKLRIIPLGGLSNVTKNMYAYEFWEDKQITDIILVDCGVGFLSHLENLGVDFVIPDVSYLKDKLPLIRAIFITHGHDDHIGAVPFILPQLNFPKLYAPKLAYLLIQAKLDDRGVVYDKAEEIRYKTDYMAGAFTVRYIHMTHSIPDTCHLLIQTPVGNFYHGSDFKIDLTPVYDDPPDFQEIARASGMGIKLLLSDGLGSERDGYTLSERMVGKTFDEEMRVTKGRFFMTTFASNISRIKQCVEAAVKFNRKLCFVGRSMKRNMEIAFQNRYIKLNKDWVIPDDELSKYPDNKICFILTGSQGESRSGMDKVACGRHRYIKLKKTDRILFSSDPIPGNETTIQDLQEQIIEQGGEVIYTAIRDDLHESGHGSQEDLKLLARLVNAKNVMPIGTTIRHSKAYANLMKGLGYNNENIFMLHDGQPLVFEPMKVYTEDPIELKEMIVDGGSIGDVGETILKERANLGREGVFVVAVYGETVRIESHGFVFHEKELMKNLNELVVRLAKKEKDKAKLSRLILSEVSSVIYEKIQRSPEIIPIVV